MRRTTPVLLTIVLVACLAAGRTTRQESTCRPVSEFFGGLLQSHAVDMLTASNMDIHRKNFNIPAGVASDVKVIAADERCRTAVQTINEYERTPDSTRRRVYALSLGRNFAFVEDPDLRIGEWVAVFLMDKSLKRVIAKLAF